MPAPRTVHDAVRTANRRPATGWSWSYDSRLYYLRDGADTVGTVSFLPGAVQHEAVLMDTIVAHLNKENDQ